MSVRSYPEGEAMSTEMEEETDGDLTVPTPEQHYYEALNAMKQAHTLGIGTSMEFLLEALAQAMMGGLRDGLDYSAKQKASELAESRKPGYGTAEAGEAGREFEEDDDDRP